MQVIEYDNKSKNSIIPSSNKKLWFDMVQKVLPIISEVKNEGDKAVYKYAKKFDNFKGPLKIPKNLIESAKKSVSNNIKESLIQSINNIKKFHEQQNIEEWSSEIMNGITVGELVRPLERIGCYVPGGKYPLVSSVIMTVVPAKVAGVEEIIVCTPNPTPEILLTCDLLGIESIFRVGGAQAISAMAYGTETLPRVQKIVGPGNIYVTAAKKVVYGDVEVDFIAGPSEVLIIADDKGNASYIACDMIAQAEHDENATSILITTSKNLATKVIKEIENQLQNFSNEEIARTSIDNNSKIILVNNLDEAFNISNQIAPEHLEVFLEDFSWSKKIKNAGAIFWGKYSVESAGDYASGPNHVLPTNGVAARCSGLSVRNFLKTPTFQKLSKEGLKSISKTVTTLARLEGLEGHARSIEIRGE